MFREERKKEKEGIFRFEGCQGVDKEGGRRRGGGGEDGTRGGGEGGGGVRERGEGEREGVRGRV